MPRPKQVSDQQIRTAARKVFQEVGVKAPVSLIAKALGVTPAALFHRTGSKEQLFVMAMSPVPPRDFKLLQVMREGPAPDVPVNDQLLEILTRLSAHLAVVSPNAFLMFAAGLRGSMRRWRLPELTRRDLAAWLLRAKAAGGWQFRSASHLAEALVGTLEARHMYGFLRNRRTSVAAERRFVRGLLEELLGPAPALPARSAARRGPGAAAVTHDASAAPPAAAVTTALAGERELEPTAAA